MSVDRFSMKEVTRTEMDWGYLSAWYVVRTTSVGSRDGRLLGYTQGAIFQAKFLWNGKVYRDEGYIVPIVLALDWSIMNAIKICLLFHGNIQS
jgi:hypothetical protein